ncbi:MAG: ArnT family glycosyltransferase [Thermoleophilia bacterium]
MKKIKETSRSGARVSPTAILALLVLFALAVRVLAALKRPMIQLDETAYVRMAENFASGDGLLDISGLTTTHFSPLLPLLIVAVEAVTRNYITAAYAVVTIFGSLLLIPTYLLGRELAGERVGLMAAALMAVTSLFVDYSSRVYSESVYVFFLLLALVFGLRLIRERRVLWGVTAGATLGLAYLSNPSAVFYLLALTGLAVASVIAHGNWRQMARGLVFFLLCFIVIAAPYVIYLHGELGKWTYSGKAPGNIYASTHNLRVNTLEWEKDVLGLTDQGTEVRTLALENEGDPASVFLKHPVQGAKISARQSYIFLTEELPKVFPVWLLPLMGLGLFGAAWDRRRAAGVGYLLLMMLPVVLILTMYAHSRFFMPFVPLVMIWVAEGWQRLDGWAGETMPLIFSEKRQLRFERLAPWLIGAIVLLPPLVYSGAVVLSPSYPIGYKEAGLLVKQAAGPDRRIMSREYSAAYYSGGTAVALPYADYERTTEYARGKNVDYLVIGSKELADWRPTLERLTGYATSHPEWRLVDRARPGTDQETLIYQLQK